MDVLQSKLAQRHGLLAKKIKDLLNDAQNLGVNIGAQRIGLICDQYDKLTPEIAYQWMDPSGLQREVEEAQTRNRRMEVVHFFRNFLSLAPLIATWVALFHAVSKYQQDLAMYPSDNAIPFLQLWQNGFHGTTWVTFTVAAGTDAVLLSFYLLFILLTYEMDRRAHATSIKFAQKLKDTTEELMAVIAVNRITPINAPADIDKVAIAVKNVVDSAVQMNEQLAKAAEQSIQQVVLAAQQAIDNSNKRAEDLFNNKILPILATFNTNTTTFQVELGKFQTGLNDLTSATKQLSGASATLVANANSYVQVGQDISSKIGALNTTQQQMINQIGGIATNISTVAGNMTTATTNMVTATAAIEGIARQLDAGVKTTINTMTTNVDRATQGLGQAGTQLESTAYYLDKVAKLLASVRFSGGGGGGLIGWLASRGSHRTKGTGVLHP